MGIPTDMTTKLLSSPSAALPTPAQTPPAKLTGLPTPIADSYGGIFDLDMSTDGAAAPRYTDLELEAALENPPRNVAVIYGDHHLSGLLYHLPSLFLQLYERFLDISPSNAPHLDQAGSDPWVLLHSTLGKTWVDRSVLDALGVCTQQQAGSEPRFAAITDSIGVLHKDLSSKYLYTGHINLYGDYSAAQHLDASNDVILAMPCDMPFVGHRRMHLLCTTPLRPITEVPGHHRTLEVQERTPAAAPATLLAIVRQIFASADEQGGWATGGPKKSWFIKNLPSHLLSYPPNAPPPQPQQSSKRPPNNLSPTSPLWAHRGNEALLKRSVWQKLCYTSTENDYNVKDKGGVPLPDAYYQVLFEDLQQRERVQGTDELEAVDRKWYMVEVKEEGEVDEDGEVMEEGEIVQESGGCEGLGVKMEVDG